jgi:hypothetical protein
MNSTILLFAIVFLGFIVMMIIYKVRKRREMLRNAMKIAQINQGKTNKLMINYHTEQEINTMLDRDYAKENDYDNFCFIQFGCSYRELKNIFNKSAGTRTNAENEIISKFYKLMRSGSPSSSSSSSPISSR